MLYLNAFQIWWEWNNDLKFGTSNQYGLLNMKAYFQSLLQHVFSHMFYRWCQRAKLPQKGSFLEVTLTRNVLKTWNLLLIYYSQSDVLRSLPSLFI